MKVRKPTSAKKRAIRAAILCGRPWVECHYCGVRLTDSEITLDHIVPRSKGGSNWISNFVPACLCCNGKRKNKPYRLFVKEVLRAAA